MDEVQDASDESSDESSDNVVDDVLATLSDVDLVGAVAAQNQLAQTNVAIETARSQAADATQISDRITAHRKEVHERVQKDLHSTLLSKNERQENKKKKTKTTKKNETEEEVRPDT